jgi:hypothetical protein
MLNQGFSAFWYLQNPQIKIEQLCLPSNNNCTIPLHTPKWKTLQVFLWVVFILSPPVNNLLTLRGTTLVENYWFECNGNWDQKCKCKAFLLLLTKKDFVQNWLETMCLCYKNIIHRHTSIKGPFPCYKPQSYGQMYVLTVKCPNLWAFDRAS